MLITIMLVSIGGISYNLGRLNLIPMLKLIMMKMMMMMTMVVIMMMMVMINMIIITEYQNDHSHLHPNYFVFAKALLASGTF